jgi:hypothetical protein
MVSRIIRLMTQLPDFTIGGDTALCALLRSRGLDTFGPLAAHVRQLRYGRVDLAADPALVILAARGTCSSKHRLLAQVARDCGRNDIRLAVGIYLMSESNTPGVGAVLAAAGLQSIPEAHCYLVYQGARFDFTGLASGSESPFTSLLEESVVDPSTLHLMKVSAHKQFIQGWAPPRGRSASELWQVREACIAGLTPGVSPF